MRYVILRDDDTNALTPVAWLEKLYRPFLDRALPVTLATIPNVRTDITYGPGILEGFLVARNGYSKNEAPISENAELVEYLKANPGYHFAQHGYNHEFIRGACEFEQSDRPDLVRRLEGGIRLLEETGLGRPQAFVAPYDRFTAESFQLVAERFSVISTGWFEWGRLPAAWKPAYLWKKLKGAPHWKANGTLLLSHPGCHLSYHRPYESILPQIKTSIRSQKLTVLVTHWWEFFRDKKPDEGLIDVLHQTADFLAGDKEVKVISFDDLAKNKELI